MKIIVTGGAGFIGSATIRYLVDHTDCEIVNLDKLTYAGNLDSLESVRNSERYAFERVDICDRHALDRLLQLHAPDAIIHLAAESHVDRSIDRPDDFVATNVNGTYTLLQAALEYWRTLDKRAACEFRFLHVSTDEVYGDLAGERDAATESTRYAPSSPYSATKAASDHLVRAWGRTFGLPVLVTNCSNNYGPNQFPEKLIPHMILSALAGRPLPVYGDGKQIRDWLYVEDHARALWSVLARGSVGETYNLGGQNERRNIDVVKGICGELETCALPPRGIGRFEDLITFVKDRPGHDGRYAIDANKAHREIGWEPLETFETGMRKTVRWYLENRHWWERVLDGRYRLERMGLQS